MANPTLLHRIIVIGFHLYFMREEPCSQIVSQSVVACDCFIEQKMKNSIHSSGA